MREQHEAVAGPLADALDRGERELEVVVGRRRRRSERARIRRVDAERVTGEDGARRGIRERDVVLGVARGRERLQVPTAELDAVAVGERADPLDRNGFDGTEERPGGLATVDRRHARYQTRGVGQVSRTAFVHPDGRVREALGDPPYPARVVEVDVRDGDVRQVGGSDPEPLESRDDGFEGGARSGLDDRGLVGFEQVGGRVALAPAVERIDRGDASRDLEHDRLHVASLRVCRRAMLRSGAKGGVGW